MKRRKKNGSKKKISFILNKNNEKQKKIRVAIRKKEFRVPKRRGGEKQETENKMRIKTKKKKTK